MKPHKEWNKCGLIVEFLLVRFSVKKAMFYLVGIPQNASTIKGLC